MSDQIEPEAAARATATPAIVRKQKKSGCQVVGCTIPIPEDSRYFKRYKICEQHAHAPELLVDGEPSRFCQQCGRFHPIAEFDGTRRSCRAMLAQHNARRKDRRMAKGKKDRPLRGAESSDELMAEVSGLGHSGGGFFSNDGSLPLSDATGGFALGNESSLPLAVTRPRRSRAAKKPAHALFGAEDSLPMSEHTGGGSRGAGQPPPSSRLRTSAPAAMPPLGDSLLLTGYEEALQLQLIAAAPTRAAFGRDGEHSLPLPPQPARPKAHFGGFGESSLPLPPQHRHAHQQAQARASAAFGFGNEDSLPVSMRSSRMAFNLDDGGSIHPPHQAARPWQPPPGSSMLLHEDTLPLPPMQPVRPSSRSTAAAGFPPRSALFATAPMQQQQPFPLPVSQQQHAVDAALMAATDLSFYYHSGGGGGNPPSAVNDAFPMEGGGDSESLEPPSDGADDGATLSDEEHCLDDTDGMFGELENIVGVDGLADLAQLELPTPLKPKINTPPSVDARATNATGHHQQLLLQHRREGLSLLLQQDAGEQAMAAAELRHHLVSSPGLLGVGAAGRSFPQDVMVQELPPPTPGSAAADMDPLSLSSLLFPKMDLTTVCALVFKAQPTELPPSVLQELQSMMSTQDLNFLLFTKLAS